MTWEQRLDKFEIIIPFAGLILLGILGAFLVYGLIIGMAFACSSDCSEMYLGDNWTLGYHNATVQECLK